MAQIELAQPINRHTVEQAQRRAAEMQRRFGSSESTRFVEKGLRAARQRDPKLLAAMERAAEVLVALQEEQMGRTQRDIGRTMAERASPMVVGFWREAYKAADRGEPPVQLGFIYGAAAELAGY